MKNSIRNLIMAVCVVLPAYATLKAQSSLVASVVTQPCNNNGAISVTVTGMTPPISYTYGNWSGNQNIVHNGVSTTTDIVTGLSAYYSPWWNANTWYIAASDGVTYDSVIVALTPPFNASYTAIPGMCPAPNTLQASTSGGTNPFTYVWTNLGTNQTYNGSPAQVPDGNYGLTITDGAGCMLSAAGFSGGISVKSQSSIQLTVTGTAANCTNGTASVTATGGVPPYTYLWSNNATTQNISGLMMGQVTCTVTDAQGCSEVGFYYVQQAVTINFNSTITHATCLQNNGAVTGFVNGGTAPYTFLWSNGATTQNLSNVPGGQSYQVQITDANNCQGQGWAYISVTSPINVLYNSTSSSCTGSTGGSTLSLSGGQAPYTVIWYTFPSNSTGVSISNKPAGTYSFKVTDANGCVKTGGAVIGSLSTLSVTLNNHSIMCPQTTGTLNPVVNGTNGPFTYSWSNSATTSSIANVPLGFYSLMVTDNVGCSQSVYASVKQISPVNVGFNTTPVTCLYSTNGVITAQPWGGTSPYTYLWGNSQTGASATGLGMGFHSVTVTDANGCKKTASAYVSNAATSNNCFCTITGTVFADANNDCVKNAGENGIQNIQIHLSNFGYAYTNSNGVYSFQVPSGTYTISESVQQIYPLATCQTNNMVVTVTASNNCVTTVNFANNVIPISDLKILTINQNFPIPGNTYTQKIVVQNDGTLTENTAKLGYTHSGQLSYSSSSPWSLTQQNASTYPNWYSITSGFPTLAPGASSSSFLNYNVATNVPLNTVVDFNDTIAKAAPIATNWLTDNTPWNNVNYHNATVIGSYDPNFKEVNPKGHGPTGDIMHKDSILTYIVHFQNTGSYYAQNVVVVDTIDPNLQISSMRPGYSDHKYTVTLNENRVARFSFANIQLPWKSAYGDHLSSGMFTYSIKLKPNLALGTQIRNSAAIYFDYNEPIITNTTINTLTMPVAISEQLKPGVRNFLLFPNPAQNYFTLVVDSEISSGAELSIYDISGRIVATKKVALSEGQNSLMENTTYLQNGIYFVEVKQGEVKRSQKLVISK